MYELHYIDRATGAHEFVTVSDMDEYGEELRRIFGDLEKHFLYARDCDPQPALVLIG